MQRFFNTAGPIKVHQNYNIDPLHRLDWEDTQYLIDTERYFVLHAPRQTGKTSTLLAMMQALNEIGEYKALYVNIEAAQTARHDVEKGIATVCEAIAQAASVYQVEPDLPALHKKIVHDEQAHAALNALLTRWAQMSDKPIVLFLDEVDALVGDTLISLLRQIRAGYAQRPESFPKSIVLCGVRDVRDYRIHTGNKEIVTGGSAFNIKTESLRLGSLMLAEVHDLYQQHTHETGQVFEEGIFPLLWEDTQGQPWLINALGHEMVWKDKTARDRSTPITVERYRQARDRLIRSRATHLDQLAFQLKEPRVHQVVSALLNGEDEIAGVSPDDIQYVTDLGLITNFPQVRISNKIYQEIIPREITFPIQVSMTQQQLWYLSPERHLDMYKLISAFQQFFRENSDVWLSGIPYKEAGPHLLLQAFLQRIVNGGGRIHREYALGRKRTDLLLEWPLDEAQGFYGEVQRVVIELKILYGALDTVLPKTVQQTVEYAQQCGVTESHAIIFNRDTAVSWEDKIWHETHQYDGLTVEVWGS